MSLNIIGRENLPNLYIKEVSIDSYGKSSLLVSVVVYLKDLKDGNFRFQWYENDLLRKNMKILVVASSSKEFNSSVEKGNYSHGFMPKHFKHIPGYDTSKVQYKLMSLQNINKEKMATSAEKVEGGTLYTFGYRCNFVVNDRSDVSVYAANILDIDQFSLQEGLDLSYGNINSFHGAIAGEKVLVNGGLQKQTNLFLNKNNELWQGPVHQHAGKYMAGSKHSSVNHPFLKNEIIQNTKIKDYRITYKGKKNLNRTKIKKNPFVSRMYVSHNAEGHLKGTFSIDMKKFFIQNTKFGNLLLQLNEDSFNSMMSKIKINRISIDREAILTSSKTSPSGTKRIVPRRVIDRKPVISSFDAIPYNLTPQYRYYNSTLGRARQLRHQRQSNSVAETLRGSIVEINESDSLELRTFCFSDLGVSFRTSGFYRYRLSLEFKDPTYDYVKEMVRELKSGFAKFKLYKSKIEKRINYDYNLNKTKDSFIARMEDTTWLEFLNTYLKFYDLLFDSSENEIANMGHQIISLINPRAATTLSLGRFFSHYQYLLNYFMNYFKFSGSIFNEPSKRGNVNVNPNEGRILWDYKFRRVFNFRKNKCGLSFLPDNLTRNQTQIPIIRPGSFRAGGKEEALRFLKGKPRFTTSQIPVLSDNLLGYMNNIENYLISYKSPRSIRVEEKRLDITMLEKIDIFEFNHFYNKFVASGVDSSYRRQNRRQIETANRQRSSFHIRKPPPKVLAKREEADKKIVGNVMGSNSSMSPSTKQHTKINNNVIKPNIKVLFSSFESNIEAKERRSKKEYSPETQTNLITSLVGSRGFSPQSLETMPLQLKALIGSKYAFSKTNILASKVDLMASPLTKDLVNVLFFTIIRVEYLSGYQVGKDGEINLKSPIWKPLTMRDLDKFGPQGPLCKMSFYSNPALKIDKSPLDSFNIENEYFYIGHKTKMLSNITQGFKNDPLDIERKNLLSGMYGSFKEANKHPIEYAQSIIINQTKNKDGPLRFVDYGVQEQQLAQSNDFTRAAGTAPGSSGGSY